jgi:hypothetical protein
MSITRMSRLLFTRPSNTTAYTAGDVIGVADSGTPANAGSAIHRLDDVVASDRFMMLQEAQLLIHVASVNSGMSGFRLHFYDASPTAILDNAAFDLVANDRTYWLDSVDLPTPTDRGSTITSQMTYPGVVLRPVTGSNSIYVQLETLGAYTPTSAAVYELRCRFLEMGL